MVVLSWSGSGLGCRSRGTTHWLVRRCVSPAATCRGARGRASSQAAVAWSRGSWRTRVTNSMHGRCARGAPHTAPPRVLQPRWRWRRRAARRPGPRPGHRDRPRDRGRPRRHRPCQRRPGADRAARRPGRRAGPGHRRRALGRPARRAACPAPCGGSTRCASGCSAAPRRPAPTTRPGSGSPTSTTRSPASPSRPARRAARAHRRDPARSLRGRPRRCAATGGGVLSRRRRGPRRPRRRPPTPRTARPPRHRPSGPPRCSRRRGSRGRRPPLARRRTHLNGPLRRGKLVSRGTTPARPGLQSDVRRAAVAPGPNSSRYERPRAVRRSRPDAQTVHLPATSATSRWPRASPAPRSALGMPRAAPP